MKSDLKPRLKRASDHFDESGQLRDELRGPWISREPYLSRSTALTGGAFA